MKLNDREEANLNAMLKKFDADFQKLNQIVNVIGQVLFDFGNIAKNSKKLEYAKKQVEIKATQAVLKLLTRKIEAFEQSPANRSPLVRDIDVKEIENIFNFGPSVHNKELKERFIAAKAIQYKRQADFLLNYVDDNADEPYKFMGDPTLLPGIIHDAVNDYRKANASAEEMQAISSRAQDLLERLNIAFKAHEKAQIKKQLNKKPGQRKLGTIKPRVRRNTP